MSTSCIPARRFRAVVITALMGVLVTGSLAPTIAQESTKRKRDPVVALDTPRPYDAHPALTETTIDIAIWTMLCLEARAAINVRQLDQPGRQWVLAHGHRCRDERLLFDAVGF